MRHTIITTIAVTDIPAAPGTLGALADALVLHAGGGELAAALAITYTVRAADHPQRVRADRLDREAARLRERLAPIDRERAA